MLRCSPQKTLRCSPKGNDMQSRKHQDAVPKNIEMQSQKQWGAVPKTLGCNPKGNDTQSRKDQDAVPKNNEMQIQKQWDAVPKTLQCEGWRHHQMNSLQPQVWSQRHACYTDAQCISRMAAGIKLHMTPRADLWDAHSQNLCSLENKMWFSTEDRLAFDSCWSTCFKSWTLPSQIMCAGMQHLECERIVLICWSVKR